MGGGVAGMRLYHLAGTRSTAEIGKAGKSDL
jgi:hypothetical protein